MCRGWVTRVGWVFVLIALAADRLTSAASRELVGAVAAVVLGLAAGADHGPLAISLVDFPLALAALPVARLCIRTLAHAPRQRG